MYNVARQFNMFGQMNYFFSDQKILRFHDFEYQFGWQKFVFSIHSTLFLKKITHLSSRITIAECQCILLTNAKMDRQTKLSHQTAHAT